MRFLEHLPYPYICVALGIVATIVSVTRVLWARRIEKKYLRLIAQDPEFRQRALDHSYEPLIKALLSKEVTDEERRNLMRQYEQELMKIYERELELLPEEHRLAVELGLFQSSEMGRLRYRSNLAKESQKLVLQD